jgi:hypothetical protein
MILTCSKHAYLYVHLFIITLITSYKIYGNKFVPIKSYKNVCSNLTTILVYVYICPPYNSHNDLNVEFVGNAFVYLHVLAVLHVIQIT